MSALQTFEGLLFGIEAEAFGHDHAFVAFHATAMAVQVNLECSLGAGHARVVNGKTTNRYPGSYGELAAMQIRAASLT